MANVNGNNGPNTLDGTILGDLIKGFGGDDIITAGLGKDDVFGGTENDRIDGGGGDDNLRGEAGNDIIEGSGGADIINGGAGIDTVVYTGNNNDIIIALDNGGREGDAEGDRYISIENVNVAALNDSATVFGNSQANQLIGGSAGDGLVGSGGNDELRGQGGNDQLQGNQGDDLLEGGRGADQLSGQEGLRDIANYERAARGIRVDLSLGPVAQPSTGDDDDEAVGDILRDIEGVSGTNFDDVLIGDANDNIFFGLRGFNELRGGDGDDTYVHNMATASAGQQTTIIEAQNNGSLTNPNDPGSNDLLSIQLDLIGNVKQSGFDLVIFAKVPPNVPPAQVKADTEVIIKDHFAGAQVEKLFDTTTGDVVTLSTALLGGNSPGLIAGTDEAGETIDGAGGDDYLFGNGGNDTLIGGKGKDLLDGGQGDDTLTGGGAADRFIFHLGDGNDVVTDFKAGPGLGDVLDLTSFGFADLAAVKALTADNADGDAVLQLTGSDSITLRGVSTALLNANDLLLTPPEAPA